MRRILSILGRSERTVPPHEQCRQPACSRPKRGEGLDADLCDECHRELRRDARKRGDVLAGDADSFWEVRCFDCGECAKDSKRGHGPPKAVCPKCGSRNVELNDITKIGSDTNV